MSIVNLLSACISDMMQNKGRFPAKVVEENLECLVGDIIKNVSEDLWLQILEGIFRDVIAVDAHLPSIGFLCAFLKGLDPEKKFPFNEILNSCYDQDCGR